MTDTTQPHPEPSEEATFPPFPQNAIMSADAWRWSTERDSIWLHRVVVGQSQLNAMRVERDAALADTKEIRARWNDAENELAALKAAPVVDVERIMALADRVVTARMEYQDTRRSGEWATYDAAREALRASLASPEGSPR